MYVLGYELFILGNRVLKENKCCYSFAPTFLERRGMKLFGNAFLSLHLQTIFCSAVVCSFQLEMSALVLTWSKLLYYFFFLLSVNNKENLTFFEVAINVMEKNVLFVFPSTVHLYLKRKKSILLLKKNPNH